MGGGHLRKREAEMRSLFEIARQSVRAAEHEDELVAGVYIGGELAGEGFGGHFFACSIKNNEDGVGWNGFDQLFFVFEGALGVIRELSEAFLEFRGYFLEGALGDSPNGI